jgi:hypothetical protein
MLGGLAVELDSCEDVRQWLLENYPYYEPEQREALVFIALTHIQATLQEMSDEWDLAEAGSSE